MLESSHKSSGCKVLLEEREDPGGRIHEDDQCSDRSFLGILETDHRHESRKKSDLFPNCRAPKAQSSVWGGSLS